MSRRLSRFVELIQFALLLGFWTSRATAQACCAGAGVVTPGRLAVHEAALLGLSAKVAVEHGSFDDRGTFYATPGGASELDLEQDAFGAVRFFERGQAALLVPLVETRRSSAGHSELGGGPGDVNLNLRYDLTLAGASVWLPGFGVLAGITIPTGTPPDAERLRPLATDATGTGAFQGNLGVAVEQAFGPWLLSATGIVAKRAARTVRRSGSAVPEQLAAQLTALIACAYVFESEAALAVSASYTVEGDARINAAATPGSARRATTLSASGLLPLSDHVRLQASLFGNPPLSGLSANQLGTVGVIVTAVHSWF